MNTFYFSLLLYSSKAFKNNFLIDTFFVFVAQWLRVIVNPCLKQYVMSHDYTFHKGP